MYPTHERPFTPSLSPVLPGGCRTRVRVSRPRPSRGGPYCPDRQTGSFPLGWSGLSEGGLGLWELRGGVLSGRGGGDSEMQAEDEQTQGHCAGSCHDTPRGMRLVHGGARGAPVKTVGTHSGWGGQGSVQLSSALWTAGVGLQAAAGTQAREKSDPK